MRAAVGDRIVVMGHRVGERTGGNRDHGLIARGAHQSGYFCTSASISTSSE